MKKILEKLFNENSDCKTNITDSVRSVNYPAMTESKFISITEQITEDVAVKFAEWKDENVCRVFKSHNRANIFQVFHKSIKIAEFENNKLLFTFFKTKVYKQ